ncbi:hypothetical protein PG996_003500 [Apiospora saccharicola]|uniref:Uncharacterized protein n=1 Tax=Apiospora saccharicola TaxID=335842 RepID=A0ABR1W4C7_9PEZI
MSALTRPVLRRRIRGTSKIHIKEVGGNSFGVSLDESAYGMISNCDSSNPVMLCRGDWGLVDATSVPRSITPENLLLLLDAKGSYHKEMELPKVNMEAHAGYLVVQAAAHDPRSAMHALLTEAAEDLREAAPGVFRIARKAKGSHQRLFEELEGFARRDTLQERCHTFHENVKDAEASLARVTQEITRHRYGGGRSEIPVKPAVGGNSDWISSLFKPNGFAPTPLQVQEALGNLTDSGVASQHAMFSRAVVRTWGNWAYGILDRVRMSSEDWESLEARAKAYGDGNWAWKGMGEDKQPAVANSKKELMLDLISECLDILQTVGCVGTLAFTQIVDLEKLTFYETCYTKIHGVVMLERRLWNWAHFDFGALWSTV